MGTIIFIAIIIIIIRFWNTGEAVGTIPKKSNNQSLRDTSINIPPPPKQTKYCPRCNGSGLEPNATSIGTSCKGFECMGGRVYV